VPSIRRCAITRTALVPSARYGSGCASTRSRGFSLAWMRATGLLLGIVLAKDAAGEGDRAGRVLALGVWLGHVR